jgi:hypothetical protein
MISNESDHIDTMIRDKNKNDFFEILFSSENSFKLNKELPEKIPLQYLMR